MQFGLLILTLVSALIGTLAKTRDDSATKWWRRVWPWGWAIASILLISFALSLVKTWENVRANKLATVENAKLQSNVSSLVEQLGETRGQVSKLLDQLEATKMQVTRSQELLETTEILLNQERSATVLAIFDDWEMVGGLYLQLEVFAATAGEVADCLDDPFWFVPGLANYQVQIWTTDLKPELYFTSQRRPHDQTPEQKQAGEEAEERDGHTTYSPGTYVWHEYALSGVSRLAKLVYQFRPEYGLLEIRLRFQKPPDIETINIVKKFVTDRKRLDAKVLAPIEKKALMALRRKIDRKRMTGDEDEALMNKHPGVFWRVRVPLTVKEVAQVPESEGGEPEELLL